MSNLENTAAESNMYHAKVVGSNTGATNGLLEWAITHAVQAVKCELSVDTFNDILTGRLPIAIGGHTDIPCKILRNGASATLSVLVHDRESVAKAHSAPEPEPEQGSASSILRQAATTLAERGKQYDRKGKQERSMATVVAAFNTVHGTQLTEKQGWDFMVLLKMVRGANKPHEDSALDMVVYAALSAETVVATLAAQTTTSGELA